jgi:hypothetical protein
VLIAECNVTLRFGQVFPPKPRGPGWTPQERLSTIGALAADGLIKRGKLVLLLGTRSVEVNYGGMNDPLLERADKAIGASVGSI